MMDMGKLINDAEAMKRFGMTVAAWDLKAMKPKQVMSVPGSSLEIRWSLNPKDNWAVTVIRSTIGLPCSCACQCAFRPRSTA